MILKSARLLIRILTVFVLMTEMGVAQTNIISAEYKTELVKFQDMLKAGRIDEGVNLLDSLIANYPEYPEAYYAKSLLYAQAGNVEAATELAEKVVQISPEDITYNNHLFNLYRTSRSLEKIIPLLDELQKYHPNNTGVYREKMLVLNELGELDKALQVYDEATVSEDAADSLDLVKAELLLQAKRPDEAKAILEKWYNNNTEVKEIYGSLAYIYSNEKRHKDAVQVVKKGLEVTHNDVLNFDLADAYSKAGDNNKAYAALETAFRSANIVYPEKFRVLSQITNFNDNNRLRITDAQMQTLANILITQYPRMPEVYVLKADVLWRNGELAEARTLYLTSLGMNSSSMDTWRKLINIEMSIGDYESAAGHGLEALGYFPDRALIHYFTGVAFMLNKDNNNARTYLEKALDYSERENDYVKSMIYSGLGDLYHEIDMHKVSDAAYEEAILLDSTNVTAMNNLAYYLSLRKKDLEKAARYAKKAVEIDSGSTTFQDTYAWVLFQQQKYQEAKIWIEKAISGNAASAVLFEHYGDVLMKLGKPKDAIKQYQKALNQSDSGESVNLDKINQKIREKKYIE